MLVANKASVDKQEHDALEFFFNSVSRLFVVIDPEGRIQRANLAFRRFSGPAGAACDSKLTAFLESDSAYRYEKLIAGMEAGEQVNGVSLNFRIGRDHCPVQASIMKSEDGSVFLSARDETRFKIMEKSREVAETNLSHVEDLVGMGHWRLIKERFVEWSDGMHRIFETDPLDGMPSIESIHGTMTPAESERVAKAFDECIRESKHIRTTHSVQSQTGDRKLVEVVGSPLTNDNGKVIGVHGVSIDRTNSLAALSELMDNGAIVNQFLDHAPLGVVVLDNDSRVTIVSQRWLDDVELTREDVLGRRPDQIFKHLPMELSRAVSAALKGETRRAERFRMQLSKKDIWINWTLSPWYDGDKIGGCVYTQSDVTDLEREYQSLEASRNRLQVSLNLAGAGAWETDIRGRKHHVEGDWQRFCSERPPVDFFPKHFMQMVHADDRERVQLAWRAHIARNKPFRMVHRYENQMGELLNVETVVKLFRDEETGEPVRIIGSINEVGVVRTGEPASSRAEDPGDGINIQTDQAPRQVRDVKLLGPQDEEASQMSSDAEVTKVLVAEDNPMNRRIMSTLLEPMRFTVTFVENGEEALQAVQSERFDLAIMDLKMPVMDGIAATRAIRSWERVNMQAEMPIFALSASGPSGHGADCEEVGFNGFLSKPLNLQELCGELKRHVPQYDCNDETCAA